MLYLLYPPVVINNKTCLFYGQCMDWIRNFKLSNLTTWFIFFQNPLHELCTGACSYSTYYMLLIHFEYQHWELHCIYMGNMRIAHLIWSFMIVIRIWAMGNLIGHNSCWFHNICYYISMFAHCDMFIYLFINRLYSATDIHGTTWIALYIYR